MSARPLRILFVCMGNICRSPAGEGVLTKLVTEAGLAERIGIDSAGTIGMHAGDRADSRMRAAAARRRYDLTSRARQVVAADLDAFDLILTMDEDNHRGVLALASTDEQRARVQSFCSFCEHHSETAVPDPYYGGPQGFEHVLDLLEDGCQGVLAWAQARL
ncbi:low molecular weight protein-tyrosine-phosphatase [Synoicihabitans lomoniglobus]|uniref:Low molecular weight phosphotyrosine protein phosphatase n=1 Tax=Synoicihabitans lomoniglobus TaxID=2909285 RepID=A0AAE9ZZX5_9BACT|nr:low molecular weight phosphotyrosine protein phosphatase [Opitutaceae bacterium LMO-M01]WED64603.1 low molecular weight phosphotyrosine protein phosphatase [Opitutaceae bacterium LMO-M01]